MCLCLFVTGIESSECVCLCVCVHMQNEFICVGVFMSAQMRLDSERKEQ